MRKKINLVFDVSILHAGLDKQAGRSGIYPRRCARGGNRNHELRPPRRRLPDRRRTSPSVPATWYQKPRRVPRHPATVIH